MASNQMYEVARELRKHCTLAERVLWEKLRSRKLGGHRFMRQRPLSLGSKRHVGRFFVADFYCHASGLIVEVDGDIHDKQKKYDQARDEKLLEMGFRVIRFRNEEVLHDTQTVLSKILEML